MKYINPILPGFHPDPSICRVGDDFYLVNSSFEYFPAIPIYHSTNLTCWEQIGHVLTRDSQLTLALGAPNCLGIYAPTIRYHKGVFYCIVTNVGGSRSGNFFVWTRDIYGEWSEPVFLPFEGIDPSLFFDEDGRIYYSGTDKGIFLAEIFLDEKLQCIGVGQKQYVWNGSGGNNPEGPHLYKIKGWYYLMIAEGGTEYCHMVTIARSKSVYGPYEPCPDNPVLSNRSTDLPIKATGHADLVEDVNGNWWAVCLGIRPISYPFRHNLGRETMLVPVVWNDGWPQMGENGHVLEEFETTFFPDDNNVASQNCSSSYIPASDVENCVLSETMHPSLNTIYNPDFSLYIFMSDGVLLRGNSNGISDDSVKALLCRRQEHFEFMAGATMNVANLSEGDEAGLSIYMNNRHHYEAALTKQDGKCRIIFRRQLGSMEVTKQIAVYEKDTVTLWLCGSKEYYTFSYSETEDCESGLIGSGEASYLTTEVGGCFTGNYIAIYASSGSKERTSEVKFTRFSYRSS